MNLSKVIALAAIMTFSSAHAAEATTATTAATQTTTSTSSLKNFYNTVKASPFSMAYLNDTYAKFNIDGVTSYHYLYNHWKLNAKQRVSIIPSFKSDLTSEYEGTTDRVNHTRYYNTQLRYSYSGLLNTKDHGVNLSAQARYYIQGSKNAKAFNNDGYGRVILSASRALGKNTLSLNTDSVVYNKNSSKASNTHYNKIGAGYTYSFTDSFAAAGTLNWYKFSANNSDDFTEYSYYSLALDYTTPFGLNISPYIEGHVTDAKDGRDGFTEDLIKKSYVGLSLYYSWF